MRKRAAIGRGCDWRLLSGAVRLRAVASVPWAITVVIDYDANTVTARAPDADLTGGSWLHVWSYLADNGWEVVSVVASEYVNHTTVKSQVQALRATTYTLFVRRPALP